MKPPLKSFTVEVRRSRSSSSVARPNESKAPLIIESRPAPNSVSPSQARQLAERMFTSLTARSSAGPEATVTAESVFGAGAPRAVLMEKPATEAATTPAATLLPSVEDMVPAKPRKPRVGKARTSPSPATKVEKLKALAPVKTAVRIAPEHPQSNLRSRVAEAPLHLPVKVDQVGPASPTADAERQERQNWGWAPGERWKRRLRHLR